MKLRTLTILALLTTAACAHDTTKTKAMVSYEEQRDSERGQQIVEEHPDLVESAQQHYGAALSAHEDGDGVLAAHHTKMATMLWETAAARYDAEEARALASRSEGKQRKTSETLAALNSRIEVQRQAVERLDRIAALEAKEGSFAARDQLASAMLAIKEAETVNAREYASSLMQDADSLVDEASTALESGDYARVSETSERAKKKAEAAKEKAAPEYAKNASEIERERARRKLFSEAGAIEGASAAMTEGGAVSITLHKLFASGEVTVDTDKHGTLDAVARLAEKYGDHTLVVDGHTDSRGRRDKNISLSQARADAVVAYLSRQGVTPSRMTATGKGAAAPIANNRTKSGRAENRRIEVIFVEPRG